MTCHPSGINSCLINKSKQAVPNGRRYKASVDCNIAINGNKQNDKKIAFSKKRSLRYSKAFFSVYPEN